MNGSCYALQRPERYAASYDATPPNFVFSIKGDRYITHILRLREFEKPLANFFASGVFKLREKLTGKARPFFVAVSTEFSLYT